MPDSIGRPMETSRKNVSASEDVPAGQVLICGQCHELKGIVPRRTDGTLQLCSCSAVEVHRAQPSWGGDHNTYAELCKCCGLVLLRSGSKWSVWFCVPCKKAVLALNQMAGRCAIPIGRHSLMNNVVSRASELQSDVAILAYVDQLQSLSVSMNDLHKWASIVVRRSLATLNFDTNRDVALWDYLDKIESCSSLTQTAAFEALVSAAQGVRRRA